MDYRVWGRVSPESGEERLLGSFPDLQPAKEAADAEFAATGLQHYVEQFDPAFGVSVLVHKVEAVEAPL